MSALTSSIPTFDHDEIIQSHPIATLLIDKGGVILFVNAAAEQLCNIGRAAMVGRVVYDVIGMDRSYRQRMNDPATSALFAHCAALGGPMPIEFAVRIARQIAQAMTAVHLKDIVHRDLKPD